MNQCSCIGSEKQNNVTLTLKWEKIVLLFECLCSTLSVLRLLLIKEFRHTFLTAEIIVSSFYPFSNGSSPRDIGLAIGILDKFFWFELSVQFFPLHEYAFNQVVKDRIEEEKKKDR
jgi:hypothetical protein